MGLWDVKSPDGRVFPQIEADTMDAAIAKVRGQQEPARAVQAPAPAPEMGFAESMRRGAGLGAVADTAFGSLSREGARSTAGVILDPQTPLEQGASAMVQALPVAKAGVMAGRAASALPAVARAVAPAAARAVTTGVEGAAKKAYQGGDLGDVSYQAAFDTLVAGAVESVAGTAAKVTGGSGAAVRAAMSAAKSALPNGKFIFPSLAGTTKITLDEAAEKLATLRGGDYKIGREEVGWVLDALDKASRAIQANPALSPVTAGKQFLARVPEKSGRFQAIADWLAGDRGNAVRAGADVAGTQEVAPGIPLAVPAAAAAASAPSSLFGGVAGRLMGVMR